MDGVTLSKYGAAPKWQKPLQFGLYTALGCLVGAMLGEGWLALLKSPEPVIPPPPPPPKRAVVLLLDTSLSMSIDNLQTGARRIDEIKTVAAAYAQRQNKERTRLGLVHFGSFSEVLVPLSYDHVTTAGTIGQLTPDGLTRMDMGLDQALQELQSNALGTTGKEPAEQRSILFFTDGTPLAADPNVDARALALQSAQRVRDQGIRLVAVACGEGDRDFLAQLTGDPALVFWASAGKFDEAFQQAERAIAPATAHQLTESAPSRSGSKTRSVVRTSGWTGLLGLGIAVALIAAQIGYMRRKFVTSDLIGALGGLAVGCVAGAVGQVFFDLASTSQGSGAAQLSVVARLAAWILLGCGLGGGMSLFIPNLQSARSIQGGALGGGVGAVGFLLAATALGDLAARWFGAALVGFFIGMMVVLAEVAFRKAWLHVSYSAKDHFDVNLGLVPIAIGSDGAQCRVLARGVPPLAARYGMDNGQVYYEDIEQKRRINVGIGDERTFGNVTVIVAGETGEVDAGAQSYPPPPVGMIVEQPYAAGQPASGSLHAPLPPQQPPPVYTPPAAPSWQSAPPSPTVPATSPAPVVQPVVWTLVHPTSPVRLPTTTGKITVGRGSQNQLVLSDPSVSTQHAVFEVVGGKLMVTDIGSTNGTSVNGRRLAPHVATPLQAGDKLVLGQQQYTVGRV